MINTGNINVIWLATSALLSVVIGGLGYWRRSLSGSGWLGAIIVGTASAGLGGWRWGVLVVVFFVTSSALSHWRRRAKERIAADKFSKTEQRDLAQTLANGGAIALFAAAYSVWPHPALAAAGAGAIATVTADTWATELGTLSRTAPRLITTGRRVVAGTSGGITPLGSAATVAGALTIGIVANVLARLVDQPQSSKLLVVALVGGVAGALADSLCGATIQAMRWCPRCHVETERMVHRCGTHTDHLRGWRWLDNDWVNFGSSLLGSAVAMLTWWWL